MASRVFRVRCILQRWLIRGWLVIAAASLGAILLLSLGQILARNFFHLGFPGADVIIRGLVMWIVFAGAAIAVHSQRHIRIDILHLILPPAWQLILAPVIRWFASAICAALAWSAARFWWEEWHNTAPADQAATLLLIVFPLGFAMLALHFLVDVGARTAHADA